jgi:hydrogenase maturation protease
MTTHSSNSGTTVLIAGIGNILLQDDGFGPQAIARLQSEYEFGPEVELLDLGTQTLVDYLEGRNVVVLIDALSCGGEKGALLTYSQEQLRQHGARMRVSAHQPCLQEAILAAGVKFQEFALVGVVGSNFDVGTDLSPEVRRAMPHVLELVASILARHGIEANLRAEPLKQDLWWEHKPA